MTSTKPNLLSTNIPVYLVIHIGVVGHYQQCFEELLAYLQQLNLWETFDRIFCGTAGTIPHRILEAWQARYPTIEWFPPDRPIAYERATLHRLATLAHETTSDFYVLYMHTKGVSRPVELQSHIKAWIHYMLYFLVDLAPYAISLFETVPDTRVIGVQRLVRPQLHFSGNFWWSKASHIKTLALPISHDYLAPEMWIGTTCNVNHLLSMYQYPHWRYIHTVIDRSFYRRPQYSVEQRYNTYLCNRYPLTNPFFIHVDHLPLTTWAGRHDVWIEIPRAWILSVIRSMTETPRVVTFLFQYTPFYHAWYDRSKEEQWMWTFQNVTTQKRQTLLPENYVKWILS